LVSGSTSTDRPFFGQALERFGGGNVVEVEVDEHVVVVVDGAVDSVGAYAGGSAGVGEGVERCLPGGEVGDRVLDAVPSWSERTDGLARRQPAGGDARSPPPAGTPTMSEHRTSRTATSAPTPARRWSAASC
jgi:hypothetical protein